MTANKSNAPARKQVAVPPPFGRFCKEYIERNGDPGSGDKGLAAINQEWKKHYPGEIKIGVWNIVRRDMGLTKAKARAEQQELPTSNGSVNSVNSLLSSAPIIAEFYERLDEDQREIAAKFFARFSVAEMKSLSTLVAVFKGK